MKEKLMQLLAMDFAARQQYINESGEELLQEMLLNIGVTDDELRDKLNYRVFIELLSAQLWTPKQMTHLATVLITNNYLYYKVEEQDKDSVFTRSFSALWLAGLLQVDRQLHFLTDDTARQVINVTLPYLQRERDVRGFVEEQGWAHAVAHGADLAVAVVNHPLFQVSDAPVLLQGVKEVLWKDSVYTDDEDERLVKVIEALIAMDFPEEVLVEWVEQIFDKLDLHLYEIGYTPAFFAARTNTLHFIKTLYFTLKFSNQYNQLRGVCSIFIGKWMKY
ncbi:DUF2785 domain-containing protein [Solibacillus sp. FSL H8-0538]|uniref:DUF2785 domain-containing protein n=1 Tax=Solibacillus sp. FSL H8-0538 TaxID=2921400 RepID=UPI0030F70504